MIQEATRRHGQRTVAPTSSRDKDLSEQYDALETGRLDFGDLAPRIKDLGSEIAAFGARHAGVARKMRDAKAEAVAPSAVRECAEDLKAPLGKRSVMEQKRFLRSFVKKVTVDGKGLGSEPRP